MDNLWTTCLHCHPHVTVPCTTKRDPQPVHTNHTGLPASSTTHPAFPTGPTPRCPQHAQALILLLKFLRSFFFEKTSGDGSLPHRLTVATLTRESLDRLAFKMPLEALRLWFDFRFGCRDGVTGTGVRHRGVPHPTRNGVADELSLAVRGYEGTLWTWRQPKSD